MYDKHISLYIYFLIDLNYNVLHIKEWLLLILYFQNVSQGKKQFYNIISFWDFFIQRGLQRFYNNFVSCDLSFINIILEAVEKLSL